MGGYLGKQNTLSVEQNKFIDNELGVVPLITSAGSAITSAGGGLKLFDTVKTIFGGGKEAGFGRAKPGTLEWYIDKLKGVNDNEAFDIADQIRQMAANGASAMQIRGVLKQRSSEGVLGEEEYGPILKALQQEFQQAANQASANQQSQQSSGGNGSSVPATQQNNNLPAAQAASFAPAGIDGMTLLKVGGTIVAVGGAGYVIWQLTQQ